MAGEAADRFRDVVTECLGDDALIAGLREHFGKTGDEPKQWRETVSDVWSKYVRMHTYPGDGN